MLSILFGEMFLVNYILNYGWYNDIMYSVGFNGLVFEDCFLNWSVLEGYNMQDKSIFGNFSVNYQGLKGDVVGGYGYDCYSNYYNYLLCGGMVVYVGGFMLLWFLGESFVLVEMSGVSDVIVCGQINVMMDVVGYVVVFYVCLYYCNSLVLDEQEISGVEVDNVVRMVVLMCNVIVKVKYDM